MEIMPFKRAASLDIAAASDDEIVAAWHTSARQISHHHADDSGKEWGLAEAIMPRAREIEQAIRERGLDRPTGDYLMMENDRIDWDTGTWSPGWYYAKLKAAKAA